MAFKLSSLWKGSEEKPAPPPPAPPREAPKAEPAVQTDRRPAVEAAPATSAGAAPSVARPVFAPRPASAEKIDIDALVKMKIPPLPGSAMHVAKLAQDENASSNAVAEAVGSDPVLAARLLRAANSPLYAMERRVTSLVQAVNAMGMRSIYQLVLSYAAADFFNSKQQSAVERSLWKHSVATALAAREIGRTLKMMGVEDAFLCGLLHDIGKLLLVRHDAERYGAVAGIADEQKMLEAEWDVYGYTHAQIGEFVAKHWGLAEEIGTAIANHHNPGQASCFMMVTHVITVADEMVNLYGSGVRPPQEGYDLAASEAVAKLRLNAEQLKEIWTRTEAGVSEMTGLLSS